MIFRQNSSEKKQAFSLSGRILCLLIVVALTGCAGTSRRYNAEKLPTQYQAPVVQNSQTIDLSRLATSTIAQDLITAGDVIEVSLAAGLSAKESSIFPCRVMDNGIASLPVVGQVPLAGLDLQEAEMAIANACMSRGLYTAPHVTVTMKRPKFHRITVLGAVEKPATYELRAAQCDVLQAIVAAGGLTEDADIHVQVRHPGYSQQSARHKDLIASGESDPQNPIKQTSSEDFPQVPELLPTSQNSGQRAVRINLASAALENPKSLALEDGGIVMVEKRSPRPVHVLGIVRKPNRYEFPVSEELRMLDAISLAGGCENPFADKVFIIRNPEEGGEPLLIEGSISRAKRNGKADLILAPGDVVSVEQTASTSLFEAVRMVGFGVSARVF